MIDQVHVLLLGRRLFPKLHPPLHYTYRLMESLPRHVTIQVNVLPRCVDELVFMRGTRDNARGVNCDRAFIAVLLGPR